MGGRIRAFLVLGGPDGRYVRLGNGEIYEALDGL